MKHTLLSLLAVCTFAFARAEDTATTNAAAATPAVEAEKPVAKVIVILPEQVDGVWFWSYYTTESQHIVQSAIEKSLLDEGLDVIDLATVKQFGSGGINDVLQPAGATSRAKDAGATYLITGSATAVHAGQSTAYGATVARSQADIRAKLIRVSDGKVLAIEEGSALEGGMASRMAAQEALKKAAKQVCGKIAKAAKKAGEAR